MLSDFFGVIGGRHTDLGDLPAALGKRSGARPLKTLHNETELFLAAGGESTQTYFRRTDDGILLWVGSPRLDGSTLSDIDPDRLNEWLHRVLTAPEAALQSLRGEFALAVVAPDRDRAVLAVDRMSIGTICYRSDARHGFLFATHIAPLVDASADLDPQALFDYLYFHVIPSPTTVYTGVAKLEPAGFVLYDSGRLTKGCYYRPKYARGETASSEELQENLRSVLKRAVERAYTPGAGAFLSGGLDSSTVCGLAAACADGALPAYTIGFSVEGYDEVPYARIAAGRFGLDLHEYYVTPGDVASALPVIATAYDEPFGNSSALPAFFCARRAKDDGCSHLLAGDGGDELFAGNERYRRQKVFEMYRSVPGALRSLLIEPLLLSTPLGTAPLLKKGRSYIEQAKIDLPERLESYNFLRREGFAKILSPAALAAVDTSHPVARLSEVYANCPSTDTLERMMYLDWKITLADNDLRKVTSMCDLAGIEVSYPMLDDDVVDFAVSVPPELKLRGYRLRDFYKRSFGDFLPHAIIDKSKHGFGLPFGEWLRESKKLQELAGDALSTMARRNILERDYATALIEAHRQGHAAYHGTFLWVVIALELWLEAHKPDYAL